LPKCGNCDILYLILNVLQITCEPAKTLDIEEYIAYLVTAQQLIVFIGQKIKVLFNITFYFGGIIMTRELERIGFPELQEDDLYDIAGGLTVSVLYSAGKVEVKVTTSQSELTVTNNAVTWLTSNGLTIWKRFR